LYFFLESARDFMDEVTYSPVFRGGLAIVATVMRLFLINVRVRVFQRLRGFLNTFLVEFRLF
jgi:hypothetical protein